MDELYMLERIGTFLRERPGFICPGDVKELTDMGLSCGEAYAMLLCEACGVECDTEQGQTIWREMTACVRRLPPDEFTRDPYYAHIRLPRARSGRFHYESLSYAPCEAVVCGELFRSPSGLILPRLGFFTEPFFYPALMEGDTLWMSVTPNEIATMAHPLSRCHGRALTLGLGMGYYACMAAGKADVSSVTVVEKERAVIDLFTAHVLPRIPERDKIHIIHSDAFGFMAALSPDAPYDHIFSDLWHDAFDGIPMYRRLKALEARLPSAVYDYWIEPTMRLYIQAGVGE